MSSENIPTTAEVIVATIIAAAGAGVVAGVLLKLLGMMFSIPLGLFWIGFILTFIAVGCYFWIAIESGSIGWD